MISLDKGKNYRCAIPKEVEAKDKGKTHTL